MKTYYYLYLIPLFFFLLPLLAAAWNEAAAADEKARKAAKKAAEKAKKEAEKAARIEAMKAAAANYEEEPAPRRKRGRPRKNPVTVSAVTEIPTTCTPEEFYRFFT